MDSCPICGETFSTDLMPLHASSCGESFPQMDYVTQIPVEPSTSRGVPISSSIPESSSSSNFSLLTFSSPQSRSSQPSPAGNDGWKRAEDPERASVLYRRFLLEQKEGEPTLKVKLDLRESVEEQEERLISFYKVHKVDWARPLHCRLEGDVATGEGVKRHFFSLVIQKLQTGFSLDFGNRTGTLLFEGQADHLTPSTSKVLLQSDLFKMAGRMIGHSFLHGGPPLTGISPAILHVLLGGSQETAPIVLEDVADIDIRETIELLTTTGKADVCTLTEDQRESVDHLALSWDLPVLTSTNQGWLLQSLLQYAVLGRTSQQIHQLREGLQESMLWPLLEARPDVLVLVFPGQKMAECSAQMVLQNIIWPEDEEQNEDGCSVAVKSVVAGYLRKFVETVTEHKRKQRVKVWVGWERPMQDMQVEVKPADHPTSSTCFHILRLPSHYTSYDQFKDSLECCIAIND
ncbi:G2/M phase-specific E3 ubiquitin-protein ligase-like [Oryzias latipes]|uniref:G2/M phase-specific E3 ubiquitin-protein ligase-like n=1 Tax=Oryzias latipes TaxID=8090 RepID=UPI000CE1C7DA|nr:G2/M phase-specific E3 ubiquitin-protein ligase-like [Oryzias latipes]